MRGPPASGRLRAWAIFCVAESGRLLEAEALAAVMQREQPGEPWAEFAEVAAWLAEERLAEPTTVPRSAALLTALAGHPDALLLRARALLKHARHDDVLELARAHPQLGPLQAARAWALFARAGDDEARRAEATAAARQVEGPAGIGALYRAARWSRNDKRNDQVLALVDAGLARSPRSVPLHSERWRLLYAQPGRSEKKRRETVLAAIAELLALRRDSPAVLLAASEGYRFLRDWDRAEQVEARLLAEFAESPAAESLMFERLMFGHYPVEPLTPEQAAEHRAELAAFLARPRWHSPNEREWTAGMHFEALRDDPNTSPEALLAAVEAMLAYRRHELRKPYALGVLALLERTPYQGRAEAIAREGLIAVDASAAERAAAGIPTEVVNAERDELLSAIHDALGAVLLAVGLLDPAEAALRTANALAPRSPDNLARLASLAALRGDRKAAEASLLECVEIPYRGEHPCGIGLEALYYEDHGNMRGYSRYFARATAASRAARRAAASP